MSRPASATELQAIEKGKCPHCGSDDIDTDWMGVRSTTDVCNTCQKYWTQFSNGRIELEGP